MKDSNGQLDGVVDSMRAVLAEWAVPQPQDPRADKNGVLALYPINGKNENTLMFIFVTKDGLLVEMPLDIDLLERDAETYYNKAIKGMLAGIKQYLKKRKATGPLIVLPEHRPIELLSPGATH